MFSVSFELLSVADVLSLLRW